MKTRLSKNTNKTLHNIFKSINKHKSYLYIKNKSIFVKIFFWVFFIFYWILSFLVPFLPLSFLFILLWFWIIFNIKTVKSNFLYFINKTRIKYFLIICYIKIFKRVKNKKS